MYLIYEALLALGFVVLIPHFLLQLLAKNEINLRERLGKLPSLQVQRRPVFWLHCVSRHEVEKSSTFVDALQKAYPHSTFVVSAITHSGYQAALLQYGEIAEAVFLFPIDFRWCVRRYLRHFRPSGVLLVGNEFWPSFLRECSTCNVPVAVINARISRVLFRQMNCVRFFMRRVLSDLNLAIADSHLDAQRIQALGLPEDRIRSYDGPGGADHTFEILVREVGERFLSSKTFYDDTRRQETRIIKPPGHWLYRLARFLSSKPTRNLTIDPLFSNWREEYYEALTDGELWRARWINVRYYWATVKVFIIRFLDLVKMFMLKG